MNLEAAISFLKQEGMKFNLPDGLFMFSECQDGFEFWHPLPPGVCGSCFYKVRRTGQFEISPCPGFERSFEEEGWSKPRKISIDFSTDPPTWRPVDDAHL